MYGSYGCAWREHIAEILTNASRRKSMRFVFVMQSEDLVERKRRSENIYLTSWRMEGELSC